MCQERSFKKGEKSGGGGSLNSVNKTVVRLYVQYKIIRDANAMEYLNLGYLIKL